MNIEDVIAQLQAHGLIVDSLSFQLNTGEKYVRCKVEGDRGRKKSGWYRVYSHISTKGNQYYAGSYGNWKLGKDDFHLLDYVGKPLSEGELLELKSKQQAAKRAAQIEQKKRYQEAAEKAQRLWPNYSERGESDYLKRKQVESFDVRFNKGGLVVPVKDINNHLRGFQYINADGGKFFLTGTEKKGAFHLIGDFNEKGLLFIAEGYATAASIYMAIGLPVLVAFDSGNLKEVTQLLNKQYPELNIVIAADNDSHKPENTGLISAQEAKRGTRAIIALPSFEKPNNSDIENPTDFNDVHVVYGLDEVKAQLQSALSGTCYMDLWKQQAKSDSKPKDKKKKPLIPKGFQVNTEGVYLLKENPETGETNKIWVCAELRIIARSRDENERNWSLWVQFYNHDKTLVDWHIPDSLLAAEQGLRMVDGLLDRGLSMDISREGKKRMVEYLAATAKQVHSRARLIGKLGWHEGAYLLPFECIQYEESKEAYVYHSEGKPRNTMALKGSLEGWQQNIGRYCQGNPLLLFCVSMGFAAPLLELIGMETIGFHLVGRSSLGKSTASVVAGSIFGDRDFVKTWNTTAAALEPMAAEHSDSLLILDEINQVDPFVVGNAIYNLGNGKGKARATDTGRGMRLQHNWRIVFLSNGERTLDGILSSVNKKSEAGMQMRLLNIAADLHTNDRDRDTKGIFQELHGYGHGSKLSDDLRLSVNDNHGYPFYNYTKKLQAISHKSKTQLVESLKGRIANFENEHLTSEASGQAKRAGKAFALVAAAGELATHFGITGWNKGEVKEAASLLFKRYIEERGGEGNIEDKAMLDQVITELTRNQEAKFQRWDKPKETATTDTHQPRTMDMWGYRVTEKFDKNYQPITKDNQSAECFSETTLYINSNIFRKIICKDFDYRRVAKLLDDKGALLKTKGKGYMYATRLPNASNKATNVYAIKLHSLVEGDVIVNDGLDQAS